MQPSVPLTNLHTGQLNAVERSRQFWFSYQPLFVSQLNAPIAMMMMMMIIKDIYIAPFRHAPKALSPSLDEPRPIDSRGRASPPGEASSGEYRQTDRRTHRTTNLYTKMQQQ